MNRNRPTQPAAATETATAPGSVSPGNDEAAVPARKDAPDD